MQPERPYRKPHTALARISISILIRNFGLSSQLNASLVNRVVARMDTVHLLRGGKLRLAQEAELLTYGLL